MQTPQRIRKATAADAGGLETCMQSAYAIYRERMGGARLPPMDADYRLEIENYPAWVVESEGSIVAGLIMLFEDDRASIANVAVSPACQGQGVGGALMRFAESRAREKGYAELQLATHVLLDENVALYRHLGWEEIARDEIRVIMTKPI